MLIKPPEQSGQSRQRAAYPPGTFRRVMEIVRKARKLEERGLLEKLPVPTIVLDNQGNVKAVGKKFLSMAEASESELVGKKFSNLLVKNSEHPSPMKDVVKEAAELKEGEHRDLFPSLIKIALKKEPREMLARFSVHRSFGEKSKVYASLIDTAPVVEKSRLLKEVFQLNDVINSHEDLEKILQQVADSCAEKFGAACVVARPNGGNTLKLAAAAGKGILPAEFINFHDIPFGKGLIGKAAQAKEIQEVEDIQKYFESMHPHIDRKYDFRHSIAVPLIANGADGREILVGVLGLFKMGREEKIQPHERRMLEFISKNAATKIRQIDLTKELKFLAERVSLTKLYNRRMLFRGIRDYLSPEERKPFSPVVEGKRFSIIYLDADNLKMLNDLYGHAEGDRGLKAIAQALEDVVRGKGLVAQPGAAGGDEFAVFLPDAGEKETKEIVSKIQKTLQEAVKRDLKFRKAKFGVSIGYTHYGTEEPTQKDYVNLRDIHKQFEKGRIDYHDYISRILSIPEEKMMQLKRKEKRESGFIARGFLEDLAKQSIEGKISPEEEEKILRLLEPHTSISAYHKTKNELRGEKL